MSDNTSIVSPEARQAAEEAVALAPKNEENNAAKAESPEETLARMEAEAAQMPEQRPRRSVTTPVNKGKPTIDNVKADAGAMVSTVRQGRYTFATVEPGTYVEGIVIKDAYYKGRRLRPGARDSEGRIQTVTVCCDDGRVPTWIKVKRVVPPAEGEANETKDPIQFS